MDEKIRNVIEKYGLGCPDCSNVEFYADQEDDRPVQSQCEFCFTEPKSKFNLGNDSRNKDRQQNYTSLIIDFNKK